MNGVDIEGRLGLLDASLAVGDHGKVGKALVILLRDNDFVKSRSAGLLGSSACMRVSYCYTSINLCYKRGPTLFLWGIIVV
jgi:hypothetical protein